ncbi:hypothetical protein [Novosphingobium sp. Gsoil 351]|uniref:hypothetical protein n=1 Tax=Novosphingobium sp. Gsoil 351 TaxID=2675225 RepID=UPI001E4C5B1D|nr:hypothetical protein [Novosphingobium sp. Gsoil 351]
MAEDPTGIRNFQRLDARTTTSGRLRDEDLAALAAIGVRHVVNLALDNHPEALANEAEKLSALGIGYTHIPVPFDDPREGALCRLRPGPGFRRYRAGPRPLHHELPRFRVLLSLAPRNPGDGRSHGEDADDPAVGPANQRSARGTALGRVSCKNRNVAASIRRFGG